MSYSIFKQSISARGSYDALVEAVLDWICNSDNRFSKNGSDSASFNGEYAGISLSVSTGSTRSLRVYNAYNLVPGDSGLTFSSSSYQIERVPVNNVTEYRIGIMLIKTDQGVLIAVGNFELSDFGNFVIITRISSSLAGEFVVLSGVTSTGGSTVNTPRLVQHAINNNYEAADIYLNSNDVTNMALSGSVIISKIFVKPDSDLWMEPVPLDGLYMIFGATLPNRFDTFTIGGINFIALSDASGYNQGVILT